MTILKKAATLAAGALISASLAVSAVSAQTVEEIKERGTINIGMLVDFPPFGILNQEGQPDGYDADVAKLLAEDMGVDVNLVAVTGPNRIPYLQSNQVDILVASLGVTPERAEQVDFSEAYAGIEIFVFGDADLEIADGAALSGQNIGVARASTQDTAITAIAPDDANIQRFDDDASAVQALLSGQVPLIGASNTVIAQINEAAPDQYSTKFSLAQQSQGIATRKGADELMTYINDFLARKKESGELNALHEEWVGNPLPEFVVEGAE
ncbi:transporter substrate-binding domain-containing protein [Pararhizobium haloflavum]|uniref:transporter substrate-binding domain-containing protein n=1 Tax=Pararhizobium haloflavum TaxID=2037914 RepID=UPI000C19C4D6|nr:transporter substrate-binding domain-containing protein [Pararhizobium haloflavum]